MAFKKAVGLYDGYLKEIPTSDRVENTVDAYVHDQQIPSSAWIITHNLGRYPTVTVRDSSGATVYGNIQYDSTSQLTVSFVGSFSGVAYLV